MYNYFNDCQPLYWAPLRSVLALVSIAVVRAATGVWSNAYSTSATPLVAHCCKVGAEPWLKDTCSEEGASSNHQIYLPVMAKQYYDIRYNNTQTLLYFAHALLVLYQTKYIHTLLALSLTWPGVIAVWLLVQEIILVVWTMHWQEQCRCVQTGIYRLACVYV